MTRRIVSLTTAFAIFAIFATHAFGQSMTQTLPQQGSQPQQYSPPPQPQSAPQDNNGGNTLQIAPQEQPTPNGEYNAAGALAGALATYLNQNANRPAPPPRAPIPPAVAPPPPTEEASTGLATQGQPVLPAEFRGCWQGTVVGLDSNDQLSDHRVGYWTPKSYRLCYRRRGSGPFQLTFSRMGVERNESISNAHGTVIALSTDGHDYAKMRSRLAFDEYSRRDGGSFPVDETTTLDCRINGDQMRVSANVYGTRDGEPWFRARWHAEFAQVPE